jgi:hypothetical protein
MFSVLLYSPKTLLLKQTENMHESGFPLMQKMYNTNESIMLVFTVRYEIKAKMYNIIKSIMLVSTVRLRRYT